MTGMKTLSSEVPSGGVLVASLPDLDGDHGDSFALRRLTAGQHKCLPGSFRGDDFARHAHDAVTPTTTKRTSLAIFLVTGRGWRAVDDENEFILTNSGEMELVRRRYGRSCRQLTTI